MGEAAADARAIARSRRRRRRWHFGTVVFDESNWLLFVDGDAVAIESKPLELLHELCLHAGEIVSKDELLDTIWAGLSVVENSIPTAVAKLRRALGDNNQEAVATVARIGYRLAAPVSVETSSAPVQPRFAFAPGDAVPRRPEWQLIEPLGDRVAGDVWRGRHRKTGETRIFKFAEGADRLRTLTREAALSRIMIKVFGLGGPIAQVFECNLDIEPFFIESRDAGISLIDWAGAAGGLGAVALEQRLEIATRSARALAAVHNIGVIHEDFKPANILIETVAGEPRLNLVGFGGGLIINDEVMKAFAITDFADETMPEEHGPTFGSSPYRAPELLTGAAPTAKSDIYSLGLVLFQLLVGDFDHILAPGWESEVSDPLLRSDVGDAAAGDPAARIGSAAELADRLEQLGERRSRVAANAAAAARIEAFARLEGQRQARRPWVRAAIAATLIGIVGTSATAILAIEQRDNALHQEQIARASYDFLANDLLARADPFHAGVADETITTASRRASVEIDNRFVGAPLIAAGLHHSLARAFDQRSDVEAARAEYAKADLDFRRAGPAAAGDRRVALTQWAQLEALTGDASRLAIARRLLLQARSGVAREEGAFAVWLNSAEGSIALAGEDVRSAQTAFRKASAQAELLPKTFDARQRLNLRQRVAFTYLRLGDGRTAESLAKPLLAAFIRLDGENHPNTLNIRLNLIQAALVQKRHEDVIAAANLLLPVMERVFGTDHRRTLQLLAARQQALGSVERYAEAARDGERVWRATVAHEGPTAFQAVAGRADTAETQCRAGEYEKGLENARAALAGARVPTGPETALAMAVRTTLANCLIGAGYPREASPLLANIDRAKVSELVGDATWSANLDLALSQTLYASGDLANARAHFAAATKALGDNADAYQKRQIGRIAKAIGIATVL